MEWKSEWKRIKLSKKISPKSNKIYPDSIQLGGVILNTAGIFFQEVYITWSRGSN